MIKRGMFRHQISATSVRHGPSRGRELTIQVTLSSASTVAQGSIRI